jgi:hypothetical protein
MNLYTIVCPKVYYIGICDKTGVICHFPAAEFDRMMANKGEKRKLVLNPNFKNRFECLTFDNMKPAGPDGLEFRINGYVFCHLMLSIALARAEPKADHKDIAKLFDGTGCQNPVDNWLNEIGQHIFNGTLPPPDRPDLLGQLQNTLKNAEFLELHKHSFTKS